MPQRAESGQQMPRSIPIVNSDLLEANYTAQLDAYPQPQPHDGALRARSRNEPAPGDLVLVLVRRPGLRCALGQIRFF
jgi:hypothetical protein